MIPTTGAEASLRKLIKTKSRSYFVDYEIIDEVDIRDIQLNHLLCKQPVQVMRCSSSVGSRQGLECRGLTNKARTAKPRSVLFTSTLNVSVGIPIKLFCIILKYYP